MKYRTECAGDCKKNQNVQKEKKYYLFNFLSENWTHIVFTILKFEGGIEMMP